MGPRLLGVEQGNGALALALGGGSSVPRESSNHACPQGVSSVNPFLARQQNHSSRALATRSKLFLISPGINQESSASKRETEGEIDGKGSS